MGYNITFKKALKHLQLQMLDNFIKLEPNQGPLG